MSSLLQYLLNASLALLPFYLVYFFWLRHLTFFNWNRWYILASLVISALIPLVPISSSNTYQLPTPTIAQAAPNATAPVATATQAPITHATPIDWQLIIVIIYTAGLLISATNLLASPLKVWRMIRTQARTPRMHGYHIIRNEHITTNASFFGYIFLQPQLSEEEAYTVILHEDVHARRYHTLDILVIECFKLLLWFHPAVYHYKKLLQQAHEFEVDQETAQSTNKKSYAHLLLKIQSRNAPLLVNAYSASDIGQRIKMLFAKRSSRVMKFVYLLIIPCILLIGLYCSKRVDTIPSPAGVATTTGQYGVFQESTEELRYILYPEKVKKLEDYNHFLYKGEFTEVGKKFAQYKAGITGFTQSQTTGPTQRVGFILHGKGEVMKNFEMSKLLQQNLVIECAVNKQTGTVRMLAIGRDALTGTAPRFDEAQVAKGEKLFADNCAACHMVTRDMTGPALAGVESRRTKHWLRKYIRNNQEVLASGDTTAQKLYEDWGKTPMNNFSMMKDEEIDAILAYINSRESAEVTGTVATSIGQIHPPTPRPRGE